MEGEGESAGSVEDTGNRALGGGTEHDNGSIGSKIVAHSHYGLTLSIPSPTTIRGPDYLTLYLFPLPALISHTKQQTRNARNTHENSSLSVH